MPYQKIPCMLMRGGTSKGPFFDMRDLPENEDARNRLLLRVMGSPDAMQIDGLGGAQTVTSKVVMVQPSSRPGIDVDYLFAQIDIGQAIVDTSPPCGNMMAGVGPFAIERGLVAAQGEETRVMIYNINTRAKIEAIVRTPAGVVKYEGDTQISGVPGSAAPIILNLFDQVGAKTGKMFPTGSPVDTIQGYEVSLIDIGTVMMLAKASDFNLKGTEKADHFENHPEIVQTLLNMRLEVGEGMGLGDVADSVLPKMALLSPPTEGGAIRSQYFTPSQLHPSHAVSGAIGISTAFSTDDTVANRLKAKDFASNPVRVEHPSGHIDIELDIEQKNDQWLLHKAGVIRTANKLMDGFVFIPDSLA